MRLRAVNRRSAGFTLIEMIVLIILIAVFTSVAVPAYSRFYAQTRFKQSVQHVVSMLDAARNAAIENGADCNVRFDAQSESFTVTVDSQTQPADLPTALDTNGEATQNAPQPKVIQLRESVAISSFQVYRPLESQNGLQSTELRFHEDGSSDAAQITLVNQSGEQAQVYVSAVTGRATILDATNVY